MKALMICFTFFACTPKTDKYNLYYEFKNKGGGRDGGFRVDGIKIGPNSYSFASGYDTVLIEITKQ